MIGPREDKGQGQGGFRWGVRGAENQAWSPAFAAAGTAAERSHLLTAPQRVGQNPL